MAVYCNAEAGDEEVPTKTLVKRSLHTSCQECPLRERPCFRAFTQDELEFVQNMKAGEAAIEPGSKVYLEGDPVREIYTVLQGWAFRYRLLDGGRRQILGLALPGDMIGACRAQR